MASIVLEGVTVAFPVYGANAASLKTTLAAAATGGRIGRETGVTVVEALRDVSLSLSAGDRLGIMGHNGAGKSTLLQTLAGVYEPARGRIVRQGTVASLINPTLGIERDATGYENIMILGLVQGLSRREIVRLTPEIMEFSGLGDYLAMPVRTYSTGMLMRLAFSIVTSFRADIVLMDEWLSVGDAEFRERGAVRLREMIRSTGILVLASHSPELIARECDSVIELSHGAIVARRGVPTGISGTGITAAASPATAELVLHIGAPKTGSSAVQRHFCTHADEIGREGVHYPVHPLDTNGISSGHVELTTLLDTARAAEAERRIRSHLAEARQAGRRLFLSSESFIRHARELSTVLPRHLSHVVCIVRHPLDALVSHYNQQVKRHLMKNRLQQVARAILSNRRSNPVLSGTALFEWLEWCGREQMTVVPYVEHGRAIDATATIRGLLGLPPGLGDDPPVNRSYTPAAVEFKRLVNSLPPERMLPFDEPLDVSLQTYSDARTLGWPVLEEILAADQVAALERHYRPDVDRIAETFGITIDRLPPPSREADVTDSSDSLALVWEHVSSDPRLAAALEAAVAAAHAVGNPGESLVALARIIGGSPPAVG